MKHSETLEKKQKQGKVLLKRSLDFLRYGVTDTNSHIADRMYAVLYTHTHTVVCVSSTSVPFESRRLERRGLELRYMEKIIGVSEDTGGNDVCSPTVACHYLPISAGLVHNY